MGNWKLDYTLQKDAEGGTFRYVHSAYILQLFSVKTNVNVFTVASPNQCDRDDS